MDYFKHESSYVDEGAEVGDGTKIWHFSHVMGGAKIGENCSLGQNVNVGGKAVIGNGVRIQNNVSVYDDVIIEDDVFLGPSMVFTNVINPRAFIERKNEYKRTVLKKGCSIGANATIVCGVTIGEYALIGAGSVVLQEVPAGSTVVGVPGRVVRMNNMALPQEMLDQVDLPDPVREDITNLQHANSELTNRLLALEEELRELKRGR